MLTPKINFTTDLTLIIIAKHHPTFAGEKCTDFYEYAGYTLNFTDDYADAIEFTEAYVQVTPADFDNPADFEKFANSYDVPFDPGTIELRTGSVDTSEGYSDSHYSGRRFVDLPNLARLGGGFVDLPNWAHLGDNGFVRFEYAGYIFFKNGELVDFDYTDATAADFVADAYTLRLDADDERRTSRRIMRKMKARLLDGFKEKFC